MSVTHEHHHHAEVVKEMYAAFAKGDVAGILAHCSDDIVWDSSPAHTGRVPYFGSWKGHDELVKFFTAVGTHLEITRFEPVSFMHEGNHVAVLVQSSATARSTGKGLNRSLVHVYTFNTHNKVSHAELFEDTAASIDAFAK
jgi:ketosteroid isomerase-like protein